MTKFETYNTLLKMYVDNLGKSFEDAQRMVFKQMDITEQPLVEELDWKTTIEVTELYASDQANVVDALIKLLRDPYPYKRLCAPTGIGKTFLISNVLKIMKEKGVVIVPNVLTTKNLENDLGTGVIACHGDNKIKAVLKDSFLQFHMLACTVDRCSEVVGIRGSTESMYLIEDEAHAYPKMASFRNKAILSLEKAKNRKFFKGYLDVTATPSVLNIGGRRYKTLELVQTRPKTLYNLNRVHYSKNSKNTKQEAMDYINNLVGKKVIYVNSKNTQEIFNKINGWDYVNADLKEDKIYKSISKNNMIPHEIKTLVTTSLFTAGSSLKNPDIEHIIFLGVTDWDEVKQFSARFRNVTELNIHVIDHFNSTGTDPDIFIGVLDREIKKDLIKLNENKKNTETLHKKGFINELYYYDEMINKIVVSDYAYRHMLYDNTLRECKIGCFSQFEKNVTKSSKIIMLERTSDQAFKIAKDQLELEKTIELMSLKMELFELIDSNLEGLLRKQVRFPEMKREKRKVLEKIVNIMIEVDFTLEDWDLLFQLATDHSFERELKYRSTAERLSHSGVKIDEIVHWVKCRPIKTIVSKESLGEKNSHLWNTVKIILRALFNTEDFKDGRLTNLYLVSRKIPLGEEYGERIENELSSYFLGLIKEDRIELETDTIKLTNQILEEFEGVIIN